MLCHALSFRSTNDLLCLVFITRNALDLVTQAYTNNSTMHMTHRCLVYASELFIVAVIVLFGILLSIKDLAFLSFT